jgi:hypothetical protein
VPLFQRRCAARHHQDNADWLPKSLGIVIIKPKGIDDVPSITLTLYNRMQPAYDLGGWRTASKADISACGTREICSPGGRPRPRRAGRTGPGAHGGLRRTLQGNAPGIRSAVWACRLGELLAGNQSVAIEAGLPGAGQRRWLT